MHPNCRFDEKILVITRITYREKTSTNFKIITSKKIRTFGKKKKKLQNNKDSILSNQTYIYIYIYIYIYHSQDIAMCETYIECP